jgi:hypothetical protein
MKMSDEMKVLRNTVEFAIGGGSFMISLLCLCLSYLASGFWGPVWATLALASFGFCLLWCFDDFLPTKKKRGVRR